MKMKSTLVAAGIAVLAGASYGALAADDKATEALARATEAAQEADAAQEPATAKHRVSPHSHVQDKHHVIQAPLAVATDPGEPTVAAAQNRKAHFHPRDGK